MNLNSEEVVNMAHGVANTLNKLAAFTASHWHMSPDVRLELIEQFDNLNLEIW